MVEIRQCTSKSPWRVKFSWEIHFLLFLGICPLPQKCNILKFVTLGLSSGCVSERLVFLYIVIFCTTIEFFKNCLSMILIWRKGILGRSRNRPFDRALPSFLTPLCWQFLCSSYRFPVISIWKFHQNFLSLFLGEGSTLEGRKLYHELGIIYKKNAPFTFTSYLFPLSSYFNCSFLFPPTHLPIRLLHYA